MAFLIIHGLNISVNTVGIKQISDYFLISADMWQPFILPIYLPTLTKWWIMSTEYVKVGNIREKSEIIEVLQGIHSYT